jgi:serine/threonine protein kinase
LAWDRQLRRKVAIKEYFPQAIASRQTGSVGVVPTAAKFQDDYAYGLQSFLSEGRTLARFAEHPCIVSVLSLFEENGTGYLVMGYLEGTTLSQSLANAGGKLPLRYGPRDSGARDGWAAGSPQPRPAASRYQP